METIITDIEAYQLFHDTYTLILNGELVVRTSNEMMKNCLGVTYNLINYNNRPLTRHTSTEKSKIKAFQVKLINNELPVVLIMHIRNPTQTPDVICPKCEEEDDNTRTFKRICREILRNIPIQKKQDKDRNNNEEHIVTFHCQTERKSEKPNGVPVVKVDNSENKNWREELYYRRWTIQFVNNNLNALQINSVVQ
ncbi:118_t:CDS:2 [Gigaspora rosea]|nr:118_t:CDS:2 [Gigaspora rosea]